MKHFKFLIFTTLLLITNTFYGQPPNCNCNLEDYLGDPDPTASFEACMASDPNCDTDIPVNQNIVFLIVAGLGYLTYTNYKKLSPLKK